MTRSIRKIIKIDEEKCNGCGLCIPSCKEGALQIVDGKAKLISEVYCDGLGACLGECPEGALTIEERDAEEFDEEAVEKHIGEAPKTDVAPIPCGCPGAMAKSINPTNSSIDKSVSSKSELRQWPIQLTLIPAHAPYLQNSHLVLIADCTAYAYAATHPEFIKEKSIAIACPKLDETGPYIQKLTEMIKINNFKSIEVVMMEVPCCSGLGLIAKQAIQDSGIDVPFKKTIISIEGMVLHR